MIPVLTPEEMAAVDAAAPESVEVLIERAGAAVAGEALALLEGAYGRRVAVVAGKGNNGNDGRAAAVRLRRRGVRVEAVDAAGAARRLPPCDLVIDAAYGTGFRGTWEAPDPGGAPVLAVDIPSGVDGRTGEAEGAVLAAVRTVTFAALKPGLLLGRGPELAGDVVVADIGLDVSGATTAVVEDDDVAGWLPRRPREAHKWQAAVWVVAGSPGMTGAAALAARGAQRVGAGYVRLSTPGGEVGEGAPLEAVGTPLPEKGWATDVLDGAERFAAVVVGPGLGRGEGTAGEVRRLVAECPVPVLVDGDGLAALGEGAAGVVQRTTVLTPHDGEFARLSGGPPGADRIGAAVGLAQRVGCFVLLKGSTTVVAAPDAGVFLVTAGDARLATAGTGDVLSGAIGGLLASGLDPGQAAAAGAHLHGRAAGLGPTRGLVAGDLPDLLPAAVAAVAAREAEGMPRSTPVRDVMTPDVLTFHPDDPVQEALERLVARDVDGAPVVDDDGRLIGMLTADDLLVQETRLHYPTVISLFGAYLELPSSHRKFEADLRRAVAATVRDVMHGNPVACGPDDTLERVATVMHEEKLGRLPVVEDGRLVGIIARGDILRSIVASPGE